MTNISDITLLIAVIALALWPVILFAMRFLRERQKRLEHIERMTKDELDDITTRDLVISVLKKIGCQPDINAEGHITFKYQGDDFYIAAEEENRFIMIWNPWWGSINADNEALPYLKEIINLVNVNNAIKDNMNQLGSAAIGEEEKKERVKVKGFSAYKDNTMPIEANPNK